MTVPGVDFGDGLLVDEQESLGHLEPEAEALMNAWVPEERTEIVCLYIDASIDFHGGSPQGFAIPKTEEFAQFATYGAYWSGTVSQRFSGTCIMSANRTNASAMSHEIGHLLSLPHLEEEKPEYREFGRTENVMRESGPSYSFSTAGPKRFKAFQTERMRGNSLAKDLSQ